MITNLTLKNFTIFKELSIDFSPRINIIIGENSTGKSHLLKAAYCLCSASSSQRVEALTDKLLNVFLSTDKSLAKLLKIGAVENAIIRGNIIPGQELSLQFSSDSRFLTITSNDDCNLSPIFIASNGLLRFLNSFGNIDRSVLKLIFDETYFDLAAKLVNNSPAPRVSEQCLVEKLSLSMNGQFSFDNAELLFHSKDAVLPFNMTARGFEKLGILQMLLQNCSLVPGVSGVLLLDEPGLSMNPKLIKLLVEVLLELSRNGQQIILTTHNYVLLKWFDLLQDKQNGDYIRFHSLYQDSETSDIRLSSTDDYLHIQPNPIDDAFGDLLDRQIEKDMGGLGK